MNHNFYTLLVSCHTMKIIKFRMSRSIWPGLLSLLFLMAIPGAVWSQSNRPNIIYVLADDMGIGDISIYNPNGKIHTPNLDKMAKMGMRFTDAHTSSSVCTPTRYSTLTGRYNWRSPLKSGVLTGKSDALIPDDRTTVASLLKDEGYHTAFIGKWHLGWNWAKKDPDKKLGEGWNKDDFENIDFSKPISHGPKNLGFEYSYGHSGSLDMAPYVYVENGVITAPPNRVTVDKGTYSWWREGPTGSDFVHEQVTPNFFKRAIQYVDQQAGQKEPFFLYLALPSPHTPILPTEIWKGKSGLNDYGDFVLMIDHYMGQLLQTLKIKGIQDNTLIIFTTDNGCSPAAGFENMKTKGHFANGNFRGHKADIFEGGHRVPFIAQWPSVIKKNTENATPLCTVDLLATLADITDRRLNDNEGEDSYSLLPLFQGNNSEYQRKNMINHSINGSFAIREGAWKLITAPDSGGWSYPNPQKDKEVIADLPKWQLYNLQYDPGESINVIDDQPQLVGRLSELLIRQILEGRSTPGEKQSNDGTDKPWKQIEFITTKP